MITLERNQHKSPTEADTQSQDDLCTKFEQQRAQVRLDDSISAAVDSSILLFAGYWIKSHKQKLHARFLQTVVEGNLSRALAKTKCNNFSQIEFQKMPDCIYVVAMLKFVST